MKQTLKIEVLSPDRSKAGEFRQLLLNRIELDDSLHFDYHSLLKGINLLYSNKQIIVNLSIY